MRTRVRARLNLEHEELERQYVSRMEELRVRAEKATAENARLRTEVQTWRDEVARLHDAMREARKP